MIEPVIQPIFPTPICLSQLDRDFTEEERTFFVGQSRKQIRNVGNSNSTNNYILNEPAMAGLKTEISEVLQKYLERVISPVEQNVDLYITQSWLNWTLPGEGHHKHNHVNSLLSGVFYVSAQEGKDKVLFINDTYRQIKFQIREPNHYNIDKWDFTIRTGVLILFPSWLQHMVEVIPKSHTVPRISLAFNTFVRGTLGNGVALTELKL